MELWGGGPAGDASSWERGQLQWHQHPLHCAFLLPGAPPCLPRTCHTMAARACS